MNTTKPTILIIIGVTGDLSKRKLLPAIENIVKAQAAPNLVKVIGVTRQDISTADFLGSLPYETNYLADHLEMYQMDMIASQDYEKLADYLQEYDAEQAEPVQKLFYLSVPPQISQPVIELIGNTKLASSLDTKLLLEKPFGTDLVSAQELVTETKRYFEEEQIYRIDHYLAKEMAQNLIVFRQHNALFKRTWNKDFIERIEIIAAETIGIEGRAVFYEQTGALRDVVQSHLMQLAALVLADLKNDENTSIPAERLKALQQLQSPQDITKQVVRGQYEGYRTEVENPDTSVETFVSLTLESKDPRWVGVPITLTTGKSLNRKVTEVRLHYRQEQPHEANTLILRIQPNEGVEIDLVTKEPGYEKKLQKLSLDFSYGNHYAELPEAYERVFVDAIRADHALFTTSAEVLETWRILEPVQKAWAMQSGDLLLYKPGTMPRYKDQHSHSL